MAKYRDQNKERSHNRKNGSSSTEREEEFKYLGTSLTNQNSIQEEIKSRLKSRKTCYNSAKNLLSSTLLSKNIKIKIYRNIILRFIGMGVKRGHSH